MKIGAIITLAALLSLAFVGSPASADDGCEDRPGYEQCEYHAGTGDTGCTAGYRYYYHDAFYAFKLGCGKGAKWVWLAGYP